MMALRSSSEVGGISDAQLLNTLVQRGSRAILTDLELGGELPKLGNDS
jgi:hypothetical protein